MIGAGLGSSSSTRRWDRAQQSPYFTMHNGSASQQVNQAALSAAPLAPSNAIAVTDNRSEILHTVNFVRCTLQGCFSTCTAVTVHMACCGSGRLGHGPLAAGCAVLCVKVNRVVLRACAGVVRRSRVAAEEGGCGC